MRNPRHSTMTRLMVQETAIDWGPFRGNQSHEAARTPRAQKQPIRTGEGRPQRARKRHSPTRELPTKQDPKSRLPFPVDRSANACPIRIWNLSRMRLMPGRTATAFCPTNFLTNVRGKACPLSVVLFNENKKGKRRPGANTPPRQEPSRVAIAPSSTGLQPEALATLWPTPPSFGV